MLRVTIEKLPRGDETSSQIIGQLLIANDGAGTAVVGDYVGTLYAEYTEELDQARHGRVTGFRRQSCSAWSLVGAFLKLFGHTGHPPKKLQQIKQSPNLPHRTMEF